MTRLRGPRNPSVPEEMKLLLLDRLPSGVSRERPDLEMKAGTSGQAHVLVRQPLSMNTQEPT